MGPMGMGQDNPTVVRRLAAAAALAALLAAAILLALGPLRDPLRVVAVLVVLAIAVGAGWTALVHRGARRVAAAVVAVLALVGVVLLYDLRSVVRLAIVVGLVLVSQAAAKVALAHDFDRRVPGQRVGPARNGVLLYNPRSGGGKAERFALAEEARRRGVTPVELRPGDDLRALAEQAVGDGADVLGMAGGDGSQALVADVARRHGVDFVCIPAGTRNHFALDLGLDRENVVAALDAFGEARRHRVDLALVGDRIFVNNVSLGVYAAVVQSDGYRDAKLGTAAELLPDLVGPEATGFDLRFSRPDGSAAESAQLVLVSNNAYELDRFQGFGTRESITDGRLGVVTLSVERAVDVPALLSAQATGRLRSFPGYQEWTAMEFVVDSGQPLVEAGVDGEALQLRPPLRFRVLPAALGVRIPLDAPGARRAPRLGAALTGLGRVLAGRPAAPAESSREPHPAVSRGPG